MTCFYPGHSHCTDLSPLCRGSYLLYPGLTYAGWWLSRLCAVSMGRTGHSSRTSHDLHVPQRKLQQTLSSLLRLHDDEAEEIQHKGLRLVVHDG